MCEREPRTGKEARREQREDWVRGWGRISRVNVYLLFPPLVYRDRSLSFLRRCFSVYRPVVAPWSVKLEMLD